MIARTWKGIALTQKANDYLEHLQYSVFPELHQIDGFRGAYVLRRDLAGGIEFTVQTLWESIEAIRQFAGENPETAVVAPAAQVFLREFETTVIHYEIVLHFERP